MLTILTGLMVAASPILMMVALLAWAEWRDRRRAATVARQIRLTDAISAELGPVVAPVVTRRLWGPWQVELAMPLGRPAVVGRVFEITHRVLPGRYELRLRPLAGRVDSPQHLDEPRDRLRAA
jgi:hypothetical protein